MLATLNLQLLPTELPDETLQTSASLVPEGVPGAPAGFADLLRLRVDDTVAVPADAGELLPQGGSELPLEPIAAAAQLPALIPSAPVVVGPAAELTEPTTPAIALQTLPDRPLTDADISLEAVVSYPTKVPAEGVTAAAKALPAAPSSSISVNPLPASDDASIVPVPEARPLPLAERPLTPQPLTMAAETALGRERVPTNYERLPSTFTANLPPERPPVTTTQLPPTTSAEKSVVPPELPLRPTVSAGPDRGDVIARELAPLLRARPVVTQPSQALHAQLNLQPPPNLHATPAPSLVSTDLSYAAAAQQATDLISTSVRDLAWGERVGERVIMMAGNQLKSAEIRLTPAEMGPLRVQVAIDDGATNVTFHAQHAVTRDALEQALPRLREMLAENGLTLGDAQVGDEGVRQGSRDAEHEAAASTGSGGESADSPADQTAAADRPATLSRGLLDTFA
jgi:flagellar hook-length control protein FliK